MKNKKLTYFLLPLVILIWGTVFYKLFYTTFQEEEWTNEIVNLPKNIAATSVADTFSIIANYRDPFLGNVISRENSEKNLSQQKPIMSQPKVEPVVQWPNIVYGGTIKNQQSAKQLALVKINGKENILKAGEKIGVVELMKIYKDSIEVKMGKDKKVVRK